MTKNLIVAEVQKLTGDITKFKWVPTKDMLADALTKQRVDPTILKKV